MSHFFDGLTEFNDQIQNEIKYVNDHKGPLAIAPAKITIINDLKALWDPQWTLYINPDLVTKAVRKKIKDMRIEIEDALTNIYDNIPDDLLTTDDRIALHLPKRDTVLTPVGVIDHSPTLTEGKISHLNHKVRIQDPQTPDSKAMPKGQTVVIESFVGEPKLLPNQIAFGDPTPWGKHIKPFTYTEEQVGKAAYYRARFVNKHGDKSSYSATLCMLIA